MDGWGNIGTRLRHLPNAAASGTDLVVDSSDESEPCQSQEARMQPDAEDAMVEAVHNGGEAPDMEDPEAAHRTPPRSHRMTTSAMP